MRKSSFFLLILLLTFTSLWVNAQEKTLTGTILSETENAALPGVTVRVKGTNRFAQTNGNGAFTIKANKGEVLIFTHVGYDQSSAAVGDAVVISLKLKKTDSQLGEVVVTAMDIKRNSRELGYSVQTVKGTDIQQTQRENFVNSLQGRVAGVTVTPTTGAAGASSGIVLRGFNTLSGTNQPLFVVDGIIVDNSTLNSNSQGGAGIGLASDLPNRNNDYTNRIADINPSDIENVTVLKGPEATALYGSQASNGAIVITTKKARFTSGKILVTYDDNFRFQKITRFAELNNDYGPGGSNGIPFAPTATAVGQFTSFGPVWAAGTQLYDNLHHFYRTGFSQTHNLGLEFGTQNVGFRVSGEYFDDHGVVPNNKYSKYNFKISNNTKIGKYITITPSLAYTKANNVKPLKGTTANGGYLLDLYAWPANFDIRNSEDVNGGKLTLFTLNNVNSDYDNPLWSAKNNYSGDFTNRYVATLGIDITPFTWLSVNGRFGYDTYKTDGYLFTHPQSFVLPAATNGTLDNYYRTYKGYNHTISATAKKTFGGFTTRLLAGTMWQDYETEQYSLLGNHISDSVHSGMLYKNGNPISGINPRDSNLTVPLSRTRLLRNYFGLPNLNILREIAYFGEVSVGYKNLAFITYSLRFEKASPIPKVNNNYHFPGASLSLIISDIFPVLKKGNILDYAKLRASLANTARLNDPYTNQAVFVNNTSSSSIPGYTYGFTGTNPLLRPERQKTYEVGTELRFLNSAISLDAAYYNTLCTDQIAQGYRASYATGFVLNTANAASLRNEGLELTLSLAAIKNTDFSWNVTFNFNHMWSKVLTLPESIGVLNDFYNSDTYITNARGGLIRGHSTGTITGSIYQRNNTGKILINPATGLALNTGASNFLIADRTPDFSLGTLNVFRYKNVSLNFLWDLRVGGDIYNGTEQALNTIGKSARSVNRNTPLIVDGVLNDGLQNSLNPTKNNIVVTPYFLSSYYTTLPDEEFVQKDVNWLRLRDITLNYTFSQRFMQHLKGIKGLTAFFTGNDLILITNYRGADPAVNSNNPGTGGVGGYGLDLGSAPTPVSFSFGLRANF